MDAANHIQNQFTRQVSHIWFSRLTPSSFSLVIMMMMLAKVMIMRIRMLQVTIIIMTCTALYLLQGQLGQANLSI